MKPFAGKAMSIMIATVLGSMMVVTSFMSHSHAGNRWKKAVGIGVAIGVGALIIDKMNKDKRKKKARKKKSAKVGPRFSRATIRSVQAALNDRGFNAGRPDGIFGRGSRAALRQYQRSSGAAATGVLTTELVNELLENSSGSNGMDFANSNPQASSPQMDALVRELFSNSGGLPYDITNFKVFANVDITFYSHYTRGSKLTGRYDVQHGNISSLKVGVNYVYGSPGEINITDTRENKDYDLVVGPQSHTPAQAQAWARQKLQVIARMAALAGSRFDKAKANEQIESDTETAERMTKGRENLMSIVQGVAAMPVASDSRNVIIEDNLNATSQKNIVVLCKDGHKETIMYAPPNKIPFSDHWTEPVWGETLSRAGYKTREEAIRYRCG